MEHELAECIGAAAREARKALDLTQEDAAERIGVSAEFYARIERGNALPSVSTFSRIAKALDVSADTLLGYRSEYDDIGEGRNRRVLPRWANSLPTGESPEIRRVTRRLRTASYGTLRLVTLLLKVMARPGGDDDLEDEEED